MGGCVVVVGEKSQFCGDKQGVERHCPTRGCVYAAKVNTPVIIE